MQDYREVLPLGSPLPPVKAKPEQKSVGLSGPEWKRVDEIARSTNQSLSEVVRYFVQWCLSELDRVAREEPSKETQKVLELVARERGQREADKLWATYLVEQERAQPQPEHQK